MFMDDKIEVLLAGARPCPFCGCEKVAVERKEFFESYGGVTSVGVECKGCGAHLRGKCCDDYEGAFESAVELWNRRKEGMNPEDFSQMADECVNEKPFGGGGHWDEVTWSTKKIPCRDEAEDAGECEVQITNNHYDDTAWREKSQGGNE